MKGDPVAEFDVPHERLPAHVAIIMDGNGRWANARGLPRIEGHRQGAETVDRIITEARRLGIKNLTLYSFSSENWKRPPEEIEFLMDLCVDQLRRQRDRLVEHDIRFRRIGRAEGLPAAVLDECRGTELATQACTGMTLCLALNYGGRAELLDAAKALAVELRSGTIELESIDEASISDRLDTHGLPDPDLLLRTAGEMRISNFLLWQISYAEIIVTDVLWPEFTTADFHEALRSFAARNRRFGGLTEA